MKWYIKIGCQKTKKKVVFCGGGGRPLHRGSPPPPCRPMVSNPEHKMCSSSEHWNTFRNTFYIRCSEHKNTSGPIVRFSPNYKKAGPNIQSPKLASRPIWQVKQRWARRFDPIGRKFRYTTKLFLQRMKQTFFAPLFVKFLVDQNFCSSGIEPADPTLLNLPDRTGCRLWILSPDFF
jgi:hypothetical protein